MPPSSRYGCPSLIAIFLLLLSLLNIATSSFLPDNYFEKTLVARDETPITQKSYEEYLKKYFPATDKYLFYSGGAVDQVKAFMDKNSGYNYYDTMFTAPPGTEPDGPKKTHPWYKFFDPEKDLDDAEASSRALASLATGNVMVFGAIEYQGAGKDSFFTREEIGILKDGVNNGKITSINHMAKSATSTDPSQIMAKDDGAGNFEWKNGYKKGDKNASGDYGNCAGSAKRALAECDAPKPNPKKKPKSVEELKPSKGMALSIAMVTDVAPRHGVSDSQWKFYTTRVGQAVGSCGETEGEEIPHDSTEKPVWDERGLSTMNPPWPGGIFKLNIEGEACEYRCDGTNAGRLFCPKKEIACYEDSMKSKEEGMLRCNGYRLFHAVVYCNF